MKKISLNYQLGTYVGEYIIALHLPTLSTDMLKTRNVIEVSPEETAEWNILTEKWSSINVYGNDPLQKIKSDKKTLIFYENRKWYHKLEEKYLPETIKVQVPRVSPTNVNLFAEGIKDVLFDCDLSHYLINEGFFEQTESYAWCSYIILTRHIEKIPEKFV